MQENTFGDEAPLLYSQNDSRNALSPQLISEEKKEETYPLWKLLVLTMCYAGLQYCWAIQIGFQNSFFRQN